MVWRTVLLESTCAKDTGSLLVVFAPEMKGSLHD
jgi:hypothetical protein